MKDPFSAIAVICFLRLECLVIVPLVRWTVEFNVDEGPRRYINSRKGLIIVLCQTFDLIQLHLSHILISPDLPTALLPRTRNLASAGTKEFIGYTVSFQVFKTNFLLYVCYRLITISVVALPSHLA